MVLREKAVETCEKARFFKFFLSFQPTPKPWVVGSSPSAPAIIIGQKRSDRENKRKREISRDFSRFFAPTFFQSFIDPFSGFHRVERNELWIEPFFPNLQSKTNDRKDLNPRKPNTDLLKTKKKPSAYIHSQMLISQAFGFFYLQKGL